MLGFSFNNWPSSHDFRNHLQEVYNSKTPDWALLEQHQFQLLFVFDELKRGFPQFDLINQHGAYACKAYTKADYEMYIQSLGLASVPIVLPSSGEQKMFYGRNEREPAKVMGEVHIVEPEAFKRLDEYKDNGVQFQRERIRVMVPYRKVIQLNDPEVRKDDLPYGKNIKHSVARMHVIKTWAYIAVPDYWEPMLDGGYNFIRPHTYEARNKEWFSRYYFFRKNE